MTAPNLHLSNYHETKQKRPKVRFLYSPLLPMGCEARGVAFRVALPKSSSFSRRASRQNIAVLNGSVCPQTTQVEGVEFEPSV